MTWEEVEKIVFEYIKGIVPKGIKVDHLGGSDSNVSDLMITKNGTFLFNVEIKDKASQAGQFVIFEEDSKYVFSKANKVDSGVCLPIIEHINKNFSKYNRVAQSGLSIDCEQEIINDRIVSLYKNEKKVNYMATIDKNGKILILKTEDVGNFFDIKGVLRRKKSGSANILPKYEKITKNAITEYLNQNEVSSDQIRYFKEGKYFKVEVISQKNFSAKRVETDDFIIYFSKSDSEIYTLTKLSNTNNPNVIFTLNLVDNPPKSHEDLFIKELL